MSRTTRSGRVVKKPTVFSPRMKLNGTMGAIPEDEKVLYDELNKVSDSPVRKDVWEKINKLEKFDKRVKYTKDDFDDEESSFGEEEDTTLTTDVVDPTTDVIEPTTTETKTKTKKRKREEDDEDEDYIEEEFDEEHDEESDEESGNDDENESDEDIKIELEEQKLDELAKSGELVNPDEADIFEDAIPLDKLGEGPPEEEESILDS